MKHLCYGFFATGLIILLSILLGGTPVGAAPSGDLFPSKCSPFVEKATAHPIDKKCSPAGTTEPDNGEDSDPHLQQNRAKNNLCASESAVPITINLFDDLQQAAEEKGITFGNQHIPNPEPLPDNRSELKDLAPNAQGTPVGEGTKVVFVAFVLKTKTGSQESVNCHLAGKEANDFHLVLGKRPTDSECDSVTAEMIPHFRPASWSKITFQSTFAILRKHPVRITGQMFFDASHSPCHHPEFQLQGDPKRRSLWEIHPVYRIDVCKNKTLAGCKVDKESVWISFDSWIANPQ